MEAVGLDASSGSDDSGESSGRRYRWRYGPLRLLAPWACIAGGLIVMIRFGPEQPSFLFWGAGMVVLGVVGFFVYRWMAKRGL